MKRSIVAILVGLALAVTGCSGGSEPCETDVIEAEFDGGFYDLWVERIQDRERNGWDCTSEGIRNALGDEIGTRWTCERC